MAEGFLKQMKPQWEVQSAGLNPTRVNDFAIQVMAEQGIDISANRSKSVEEFSGQHFDYMITVCDHAKQSCPVFPGKGEYIHWSIPDPDRGFAGPEQRLEVFRKTRDEIKRRIQEWIGDG